MKKILLIEDNPEVRENTAEILELSGYEVLTAENGKIGVRLAAQQTPDLIVCDIMMPELDGFGVLRILGKNPKTAGIPFIFLTAKAEKVDFRKGMGLGADDYITKPFDDVELLDAIEMRLNKHQQLNKVFPGNSTGLNAFVDTNKGLKELQKLTNDRELRVYQKKDTLFMEDDYPKQVFFIQKGKLKTIKTNDEGREFVVGLHKTGDFLGFMPLLRGTTYPASAVMLEETEIMVIPQKDFFSLVYNNRDVASNLINQLADELIEKEEQLLQLAYNSVRKRVAETLLRLKTRFDTDEDEHFSITILRDDLASMVGTAKETVIRTLSDFKEENLLELKGSTITILDAEALSFMRN
ncbi:MAG: response regulator [Bacteroidota bacterium]